MFMFQGGVVKQIIEKDMEQDNYRGMPVTADAIKPANGCFRK